MTGVQVGSKIMTRIGQKKKVKRSNKQTIGSELPHPKHDGVNPFGGRRRYFNDGYGTIKLIFDYDHRAVRKTNTYERWSLEVRAVCYAAIAVLLLLSV